MNRRPRCRPGLELLELRTTPSLTVAVDAAGVLTLGWSESDQHTSVTISITGGESVVTASERGEIDVLADPAGFVTSGPGTSELHLRGVTRLEVDASRSEFIRIPALDVPAAIRVAAEGPIIVLGDPDGSEGLAAVSAPVDVRSVRSRDVHITTAELWLTDGASTASIDFTVEADSIVATGGFGGVTYSGLDVVSVGDKLASEPSKTVRYDVRSTHAGATILSSNMFGQSSVVVDATAAADSRPAPSEEWVAQGRQGRVLSLTNIADVEIRRTPSPVAVNGAEEVRVSDRGSTANILHDVNIRGYQYHDLMDTRILVDDSAGTTADHASLDAVRPGIYEYPNFVLSGAATGRIVVYQRSGRLADPYFQSSFEYLAPRGLDNSLEIHVDGVWPLPSAPGRFLYHGGSDESSGGLGPTLAFSGTPPNPEWTTISHGATSPSAGGVQVQNWLWGAEIRPIDVAYAGMAGGRVVDVLEAENGSFLWLGGSENATVVRDGDSSEDGVQTLEVASAGFATTSIAGKRNIYLRLDLPDDPVLRWLMGYQSTIPVHGLENLILASGPGGQVLFAPPGVNLDVERVFDGATPLPIDPASGGPTGSPDAGSTPPPPGSAGEVGTGSGTSPSLGQGPGPSRPTTPVVIPGVAAGWPAGSMRGPGWVRRPSVTSLARAERSAKLAGLRAATAARLLARRARLAVLTPWTGPDRPTSPGARARSAGGNSRPSLVPVSWSRPGT